MSPLRKNIPYVDIGSSLLTLRIIYSKGRDININRIFPNNNILRYLIPTTPSYINMFVGQKFNHVSWKLIKPFKDTDGSRIMIGNNGGLKLICNPSKYQQFMPKFFHII